MENGEGKWRDKGGVEWRDKKCKIILSMESIFQDKCGIFHKIFYMVYSMDLCGLYHKKLHSSFHKII
jgi:hypothetical protein